MELVGFVYDLHQPKLNLLNNF